MNILIKTQTSISQCIVRWKRKRLWKKQTFICSSAIEPIEQFNIDRNAKYLILAPHSDDEWIGCSQIILHCPNTTVCNMDMNGDDSPEVHKKRREEMMSVSKVCNRTFITVDKNQRDSLGKIISDTNPDYILVPNFIDWHNEHIVVMQILGDIINSGIYNGFVMTYQVSVPLPKKTCIVSLPMTLEMQTDKWENFGRFYRSQSFMPVERFKANECINGALSDSFAAEVFGLYKTGEWLEHLMSTHLSEIQLVMLKSKINDLVEIRKYLNRLDS